MTSPPAAGRQWGTRERLEAILDSARRRGDLGVIKVDFEMIKEALTEIERLQGKRGAKKCLRCGATSEWLE